MRRVTSNIKFILLCVNSLSYNIVYRAGISLTGMYHLLQEQKEYIVIF
jgi:hypothetical protein